MTSPNQCVSVEGVMLQFRSAQRHWEAVKWLKTNFNADMRAFKSKFPDAKEVHIFAAGSSVKTNHH